MLKPLIQMNSNIDDDHDHHDYNHNNNNNYHRRQSEDAKSLDFTSEDYYKQLSCIISDISKSISPNR